MIKNFDWDSIRKTRTIGKNITIVFASSLSCIVEATVRACVQRITTTTAASLSPPRSRIRFSRREADREGFYHRYLSARSRGLGQPHGKQRYNDVAAETSPLLPLRRRQRGNVKRRAHDAYARGALVTRRCTGWGRRLAWHVRIRRATERDREKERKIRRISSMGMHTRVGTPLRIS